MNPARIDPAVTYDDVYFHMARSTCTGTPQVGLPAGYRFRAYQPGDEERWVALQRAAEPYFEITDELFTEEFGGHRDQLADRMFFVVTEDEERDVIAGSATAWWQDDPAGDKPLGLVHWVVVHPDHRGRGLSKAMMTHTMNRLTASHSHAMLGTSSGRPWAIKVYLDFGFTPDPAELQNPAIRQAWRDVQGILNHSLLENI